MDASSPLLWALVLQAARLASAEPTPTQDLIYQVGDVATLSLEAPQRSNVSNLIWRTSSRGSMDAVAIWDPENFLTVLSPNYVGRVTFLEDSWALRISNLSTADGGNYEVGVRQDPSDLVLKKYTLAIFKINTTASRLANGSCSVSLLCEAGVGARTLVEYSWGAGLKGSALRLILRPDEKDKASTCTATALGTKHSRKVTPYEACSSATRATGLLAPAFLLVHLLQPLLQ